MISGMFFFFSPPLPWKMKGADGGNSTIADLSFLTWDMMIPFIFGERVKELGVEKKYPNYFAWNKKLMERASVKKVVKDKTAANS